MKYSVYILWSISAKKYYIGHTNNVERRLEEHIEGLKGYTEKYIPWSLEHIEMFPTRSEAMQKEKYLKSLKSKTKIKDYIAGWRSGTSRGS